MKKLRRAVEHYLKRAEKLKVEPNFYLSKSYLDVSGAQCWEQGDWVWLEADRWCLFPRLSLIEDKISSHPSKRVWCDFNGWPNHPTTVQFLDWEYLFNPINFNSMNGGQWETFRKNSRKWPRTHPNWLYTYHWDNEQATQLLLDWFETKKQGVQDADLIARYVLGETPGVEKCCLYDKQELVAINAWDENWQYINFRFCIVKPGQSFLDEFARLRFYTDGIIQNKNKLINDGGTVNNPGLEHFKDKLNPVRKRQVMSWILK